MGKDRRPVVTTLAINVTRSVSALIYKDEVFQLRTTIDIRMSREGDLVISAYEPLRISAYGFAEAEALEAFAEEFSSCWHFIAQEDDDRLAPDAQQLKHRLLDLVESVQLAHEFLSHVTNQEGVV